MLLACGLLMFTSCSDDNDSNPTLQSPTTFVLNQPTLAQSAVNLSRSSYVRLTCSQPDYSFPAATTYVVEASINPDMSDATAMSTIFTNTVMDVDAAELAAALTQQELAAGKTEEDFPMVIPVYFRVKASMVNSAGETVPGTDIVSNIVSLDNVNLAFSLAPVVAPQTVYLTGAFNGWDWETAPTMVPVYDGISDTETNLWHIVYIDEAGIKFNTARDWDGNQIGFNELTAVGGDLAGEIQGNSDGNICSSNPGWYLMHVVATVSGRDIAYKANFYAPQVRFIGWVTSAAAWNFEDDVDFTVPTDANGYFVSPEIQKTLPGDDVTGCLRVCVQLPGYDWWKTEFIIFPPAEESKPVAVSYRGTDGDQERVACTAGQHMYINFSTDKGYYK